MGAVRKKTAKAVVTDFVQALQRRVEHNIPLTDRERMQLDIFRELAKTMTNWLDVLKLIERVQRRDPVVVDNDAGLASASHASNPSDSECATTRLDTNTPRVEDLSNGGVTCGN